MYTQKQSAGFTIVELLLVIVVIAILAAITIVAYNGIQERAKNASTEQAVAQYERALAAYAAQYGQYPTPTSSVCMGEVDSFPNGCYYGSKNATFASELHKVASSLPPPPVYDCFSGWGGCRYNFTFIYNASWKVDGQLHPYYVMYYLDGGARCRASLEGTYGDFSSSRSRGYMETRGSERMCMDMLPVPG